MVMLPRKLFPTSSLNPIMDENSMFNSTSNHLGASRSRSQGFQPQLLVGEAVRVSTLHYSTLLLGSFGVTSKHRVDVAYFYLGGSFENCPEGRSSLDGETSFGSETNGNLKDHRFPRDSDWRQTAKQIIRVRPETESAKNENGVIIV